MLGRRAVTIPSPALTSLRRRQREPERQPHSELRALARTRLDGDGAAVCFDDAVADRQPAPHVLAERVGGEEGLEDLAAYAGHYAAARVGGLEEDRVLHG